ncbi:MAG: glycosyltransferase family 4 protein [Candidatus Brocadia sp.]|nr:MAG: glycosyltransferase family 4 protein [Candidatus Brocadia sp.]
MKKFRIGIDARLANGETGGIQQFIIGLSHGLKLLALNSQEYFFLTLENQDEWLRPYLPDNAKIIHPKPPRHNLAHQVIKSIKPIRAFLEKHPLFLNPSINRVPESDGTFEEHGIHVIHFTNQSAFKTLLPNIYHPHDLQHVHHPEFFSPRQRALREKRYKDFCDRASKISVASEWTNRDLQKHFGIPSEKIVVIPLAPVIQAYMPISTEALTSVQKKFSLPEQYIFYPAQTWPHKNHIGLIKALAHLKNKYSIKIPLICTGFQNDFYREIRKITSSLSLNDQVKFLGFVTPDELQAIYKSSCFLIIPTKFEAGSFPIWEAFNLEVPVACSTVTSLPEQAGDAALLFDPDNIEEMANAILSLWQNPGLREILKKRGLQKVSGFSWEKVAYRFSEIYRELASGLNSNRELI